MAKAADFKEAKYIEWTTTIPGNFKLPVKSSNFILRDCECFFLLSQAESLKRKKEGYVFGKYEELVLKIMSEREIRFPLNITVCIIGKNNYPEEISKNDFSGTAIWTRTKSTVDKYLTNSLVTFGITLHFPGKEYPDSDVCLEALSQDLGKLLDDENFFDAEIECGGKTWNVHKNVISARSETLASILQHINNKGKTTLKIKDLDKETFDVYIKYIYTGKLTSITTHAAKMLYDCSLKYTAPHLKSKCSDFLLRYLKPENACEILILANQHDDSDFKTNVISYIAEKKIPLMEDIWSEFCKMYPVLANEVLNHSYKILVH